MIKVEEVFFAGGCLWGVQEFLRYVPGVMETEAGRANGTSQSTENSYDGYSECVRTRFNADAQSVTGLMPYFFEIIDPYSLNKQGDDVGEKYRSGVYSHNSGHLHEARSYINARPDRARIKVEVLPLLNFVSSDLEHQDRLLRCPDDYCHINEALLYKYKQL
ncbi:MAG: peptide-methionine (S)-S-oxide reductase [Granulosicoccus sp.]|jgi:peptide-methionine (S)-S-oxide reductase